MKPLETETQPSAHGDGHAAGGGSAKADAPKPAMPPRQRVLFLANIPAPYRIDFFNELGKSCDLTVVFEAKRAKGIRFNWNEDNALHFKPIFLSEGDIDETHVNRKIFSHIAPNRYDQIVATNYGYYTETAALLYMWLRGIPYDLELDGGIVRAGENPLKRMLKCLIIRNAKRLFSSGKATDALFAHYGGDPQKILRYPFTSLHRADLLNNLPTREEKQNAKGLLGLDDELLVLSIGQFIHRKGYDVLLSSCDKLDGRAGAAIIGGTPTEEYNRIVHQNNLTNVRFLEFMDQAQLKLWFLAADVFVLPTREDMWGLVINEAMANALPVVTTNTCNAGLELIEDGQNGYLVEPEDGETLMEQINLLLNDDALRKNMAAQSLKRIQGYTIECMAGVHADVFGIQ